MDNLNIPKKVLTSSRSKKTCSYKQPNPTRLKSSIQNQPLKPQSGTKIQRKRPRLRLTLSPPSLRQLAVNLPTDLPIWSRLRKVLLSGKLRSVNPHDIESIDPQRLFGQRTLDIPRLLPDKPFKEALSAQEITHLALEDMLSKGSQKVGTSLTSDYRPRAPEVASKIVSFAASPLDPCDGNTTWHVELPRLAARYNTPAMYESLRQADEILEEQSCAANIFPCGGVADLHHDDGFGSSTLVQGEKLWLMYPPSDANLAILRKAYETRKSRIDDYAIFKCYQKLQDGIVFVQPAGRSIWVTPYCPHAVFTLKSSIMMFGPDWFLQSTVPQTLRFRNVDLALRKSVNRLGGQDEEVEELLRHLEAVLVTDNVDLQRKTLEAWEVFNRDALKKMLEGSVYKADDFKEIWNANTTHWEICPSCDMTQGEVREEESKYRRRKSWFQRHFEDVHWRS
ncbi:hypothetical protein K491DRAFT_686401 [Lophiostoma macrostomum CBS 122681]|uniref:JmjC domain-containing protein n=1 Tax=Lophiostoma macrostomum CBS 122681 TaxID=1314788 RepID=A0A6A6TU86_9PLEO|nr:hypothetical protein K491DRAFT_686401 [Lophiostoma macrostomum CBS 122681]